MEAISRLSVADFTSVTGLEKPRGPVRLQATEVAGANPDFSAMISEAVTGLAQQLRKAEAVSMAGTKGMASAQDVVEQVMAAEQTLQASIAVRDKIVAAYLEISRMAI